MSAFTREIVVRFEHCDAAGLMFYPRMFALVNEMVEDWFAALGFPFKSMHLDAKRGVPTVKFEAEFGSPARMGDRMLQSLRVDHIGAASCRLVHEATVSGQPVARFVQTIVFVGLSDLGPEPWPEAMRKAMAAYEVKA